jgi:hypothetical protein
MKQFQLSERRDMKHFAAEHKFYFLRKKREQLTDANGMHGRRKSFFVLVIRSAASFLSSTDIAFSLGII